MAKKSNLKSVVWMILYWALYLTLTMVFFERYHVNPETVPGGAVGWMLIVEVPRVVLGYALSKPIFRDKS